MPLKSDWEHTWKAGAHMSFNEEEVVCVTIEGVSQGYQVSSGGHHQAVPSLAEINWRKGSILIVEKMSGVWVWVWGCIVWHGMAWYGVVWHGMQSVRITSSMKPSESCTQAALTLLSTCSLRCTSSVLAFLLLTASALIPAAPLLSFSAFLFLFFWPLRSPNSALSEYSLEAIEECSARSCKNAAALAQITPYTCEDCVVWGWGSK